MADLIDRQSVIDLLKKNTTRDVEEVVVTEKNINLIMDMPKAFDVEKVVEGLKDIKEAVSGCYGVMCYECQYTKKCYTGEMSYKVAIDKAIDIVKAGGVE